MNKLISKIESLGWYGGELKVNIGIKRCFEGYHGRASETWESEWSFDSNEIKSDDGKILFPELHLKSNRHEIPYDFIKRIEDKL